jgi:hypothetical protein
LVVEKFWVIRIFRNGRNDFEIEEMSPFVLVWNTATKSVVELNWSNTNDEMWKA